jgi:hypothetical protein
MPVLLIMVWAGMLRVLVAEGIYPVREGTDG